MAISATNIGTTSGTTGTTIAITVGAGGVPSASLICLALVEISNVVPGGSVRDTNNTPYSVADGGSLNNTQAQGFGRIFYFANCAALVNTNTITYTRAGSSGAGVVLSAFYATGIAAASPQDAAVTHHTFVNAMSATNTSGTPAAAGELFVGGYITSANTGATFTQSTGGWAAPFNDVVGAGPNARVSGGTLVNAGTGTEIYNPSTSLNTVGINIVVAFKAALTPVLRSPLRTYLRR